MKRIIKICEKCEFHSVIDEPTLYNLNRPEFIKQLEKLKKLNIQHLCFLFHIENDVYQTIPSTCKYKLEQEVINNEKEL